MANEYSLRELVRADLWRCQGASSMGLFVRTWFQDPAFRPVFTLRLVQACRRPGALRVLLPSAALWHRRTQVRCGVDLPSRLRAGPGLKVAHGWGLVVNSDTVIGANVTLMQGVTIGGNATGVPRIEDDVMVCASATVIGALTLGRGAVVGAGCVVTKDVPPQTTVVGNPQRIIPRWRPPRANHPAPLRDSL